MQTAQQFRATTAEPNISYRGLTPAAQEHRRRWRSLPTVQAGEAERLMTDSVATKSITARPTRYAAPIEQRTLFSRSGTMRPYIAATAMVFGLLTVWAALVPFVA